MGIVKRGSSKSQTIEYTTYHTTFVVNRLVAKRFLQKLTESKDDSSYKKYGNKTG